MKGTETSTSHWPSNGSSEPPLDHNFESIADGPGIGEGSNYEEDYESSEDLDF